MLHIDSRGQVFDARIKLALSATLSRGPLKRIDGSVVHQTDSSSAKSTLSQYQQQGTLGAHFLIDKDGTIYQTASLRYQTWHVGPLRARCMAELRCAPSELTALKRFDPRGEHRREMAKSVPQRYPSNEDSIGIELVGQALPLSEPKPDKRTYESVTQLQNDSLAWLVRALSTTLRVPMTEVFRHPQLSRKNATEAATAKW